MKLLETLFYKLNCSWEVVSLQFECIGYLLIYMYCISIRPSWFIMHLLNYFSCIHLYLSICFSHSVTYRYLRVMKFMVMLLGWSCVARMGKLCQSPTKRREEHNLKKKIKPRTRGPWATLLTWETVLTNKQASVKLFIPACWLNVKKVKDPYLPSKNGIVLYLW